MIVTKKELDETDKKIIAKAGEGMTAKEIGYELNISQRSVEARVREMKRWFNCHSLVHLVQTISKLEE
jgi:DNA-binding NarL/FixJ family response regulator